MDGNLFISEVLMSTVAAISLGVFWQLFRSKNGMLRKILIAFFLIEFYVYTFSCIYWYLLGTDQKVFSIETFRMLVLIPKALVELVLLVYLFKRKTN